MKVLKMLFTTWKGVFINFGIIALLSYGLMHYFFNVKLHRDTLHGQHIEVPNLENIPYNQAKLELNKLGLQAVINEKTFSETHKLNAVVNQVPKAKSKVKKGRKIFLTINEDKTPTITITKELYNRIHNTDERNLKKLLEANHLKYGYRLDTICGYDGYIFRLEQKGGKRIRIGDKLKRNTKLNAVIGKTRKSDG